MNFQQALFDAAASGSVEAMQEVVYRCGLELTAELAKSQNNEGETPLIVAVKGNHLEVVKFLVNQLHVSIGQTGRFLWKGVDYLQVPPVFAAIICDTLPDQPILNFLVDSDLANPVVLDSVLSSSIPRPQKIDVLEVIGAAYALSYSIRQPNERRRIIAMGFWVHATSLRQSTAAELAIPKLPYNLSGRDQRIFGDPFEFSTVEQINELPNQQYHNPIWTEALLTLRRITSQINPEPNLFFFLSRLYGYGVDKFFLQRQYCRMIDVVMLVLDHFEDRHWEDAVPKVACEIVRDFVLMMNICFEEIFLLPRNHPERRELFANIMKGLGYSSTFAKFKTNVKNPPVSMENVNYDIFSIVLILSKMLPELNDEQCQQLKQGFTGTFTSTTPITTAGRVCFTSLANVRRYRRILFGCCWK